MCEYCGLEVSPTESPALSEHYADDYRVFAKLSSFDGGEVADAMATLPAVLKNTEPPDLVRLALVTGGLKLGLLAGMTSRKKVITLAADDLAKVASTGISFLRSWPIGFQNWVEAEANRLRENTTALNEFRARLRSVIRGRETAAVAELMTKALPELRRHPVHGFAKFERYYLGTDVHRKLGVTNDEFKLLRRAIGDAYQRSPTTTPNFLKGQFDADRIDRLVPSFRGSIAFNSCASNLKLPVYAVAQCCRPGLLDQEDCPVFATVRSNEFIRSGSLAALTEYLFDRRQKTARPAQTVQLMIAARRIGGRLKPWGSILESLQSGKMAYWIEGENVTLRTIYIWPADMRKFLHVVDRPYADSASMTNFTVSQLDAAEILNIQPAQLASEATALGIQFRKSGRGFAASLTEVLSVASIVAWSAEIAWHLGTTSRDVEEMLHHENISRLHTGWSRRKLISAEILPELPIKIESHS